MNPVDECPKEKCFFWICPGGAADMSGQIHQSLADSFKNGKWVKFPEGGCSCSSKCARIHPESTEDWFEPTL